MRFNPDAYASHPVLRPNSNDYPSGEIDTELTTSQDGRNLNIAVSFLIGEPAISEKVRLGAAVCCAYVYCGSTCYSETLRAEGGSARLSASIPMEFLNGRVEVHPSVIAVDDVAIPAAAANSEYGDSSIRVPRLRQLAAGTPWHFAIDAIGSLESAFKLRKDSESNLAYGEFEFDADPQDRYIFIRMNPETHSRFVEGARADAPLSMSTVYLAALTSALGYIDKTEEVPDDESPNGWATTLRSRLTAKGIDLQSVSTGLAAQRLLENPLIYILREDD